MTPADDIEREEVGDDMAAAEYVLGVTPAGERHAVARRIATDLDFARLVDQWETRLSPLTESYPEATPPDSIKTALDRRLFAGGDQPAAASRPGLWQSLALWRGLAAASLAALVLYVAAPFVAPPEEVPPVRLVASLAADDSEVRYLAVYDAGENYVGLSHVSGERAPDRDFELWVIEGDNPPVSVGVVPVGATVQLRVPDTIRGMLDRDAVLAISLEPAGGSPTDQPTGPVLAVGDLRKI